GGPSAAVVILTALDDGACRRLAHDVLDADDLPDLVVARALEASEGNPLFLRELLRLLVDDGVLVRNGSSWNVTVDVDAIQLPLVVARWTATTSPTPPRCSAVRSSSHPTTPSCSAIDARRSSPQATRVPPRGWWASWPRPRATSGQPPSPRCSKRSWPDCARP